MEIGIWPDAEQSSIWPDVETLLKPAADLAGDRVEAGPAWTIWTVHEAGRLIAAAHVRRTEDLVAEVVLVGGTRFPEWIARLDDLIGRWAKDEGMTVMRAFGRVGWARVLSRQGWSVRQDGLVTVYERGLC